jgi:hypothetical protein
MKSLILLTLVAATCSGCLTSKLDKTISALAKDNASAHVRVTSIYGVIEYTRSNPGANTLPHTLGPDGDIKVTEATRALAQKPAPAPVAVASAPAVATKQRPTPAPKAVAPPSKPPVAPKAPATKAAATKKVVRPIPKAKQVPPPAK